MASRSDPVTGLKGVGPARAKQLANLNIFTLGDLICHFPRGYEDRTKLVPIAELRADTPACFRGVVMSTPRTAHIRKGMDLTRVTVADYSGRINLTSSIPNSPRRRCNMGENTYSMVRYPGTTAATASRTPCSRPRIPLRQPPGGSCPFTP